MARYKLIGCGLPLVLLVASAASGDDLIIKKGNVVGSPGAPAANSAPATGRASATAATPAKGPAASASSRKPQAFKVAIAKGQSPREAWARFFAARPPVDQRTLKNDGDLKAAAIKQAHFEQDLRQTARELMEAQKFDQVTGLVEAALLAGQPQAWMYQALGLARVVTAAPSEEIERAFMSALDFSARDIDTLAMVANFLAKQRYDRRALKLFRQLAELDPLRPEPYLQGLAISRRLNDEEGLKWATLGILSQAWQNNQKRIWKEALLQGDAIYTTMVNQGRTADARAFRQQLNEAQLRDLEVTVSWTGNADIDISVVEPTGTICSFRNPRTTNGGVLLGDSFAGAKPSGQAYTETYICPQGYNGMYRLLLRKVWGDVTANKVKVLVNSRAKAAVHDDSWVESEVELKEGVNELQIDLPEGSRKESLTEAQVAQAIREQREQLEAGRGILAQQVGLDPAVAGNLNGSRAALAGALADNGIPIVGVPVLQGAVGFRPVITTLPEGANLGATAVISADRRYVRITALPLFSKVGKVLAFNIITGRITDGNPDFSGNAGGNAGGGGAAGPGGPTR